MRRTWKSALAITCLVLASVTFIAPFAAAEVMLRGSLGFSGATDEVGDDLIGGGVLLGGEIYLAVDPMIYLGGGFDIGIHGGNDVDQGGISFATTDAGAVVTFEVGALVYLVAPGGNLRPYVRGTIGRGALAWNYSDIGTAVTGLEDDAVGFFFFAPAAGFDVKAGEKVSLGGEFRGLLSSYDEETRENWKFDLDGGHFVQVRGFVTIWL